jgi:hypothetical protein
MRSSGGGGGSVSQTIRTLAPGDYLFLRVPFSALSVRRESGACEQEREEFSTWCSVRTIPQTHAT